MKIKRKSFKFRKPRVGLFYLIKVKRDVDDRFIQFG